MGGAAIAGSAAWSAGLSRCVRFASCGHPPALAIVSPERPRLPLRADSGRPQSAGRVSRLTRLGPADTRPADLFERGRDIVRSRGLRAWRFDRRAAFRLRATFGSGRADRSGVWRRRLSKATRTSRSAPGPRSSTCRTIPRPAANFSGMTARAHPLASSAPYSRTARLRFPLTDAAWPSNKYIRQRATASLSLSLLDVARGTMLGREHRDRR